MCNLINIIFLGWYLLNRKNEKLEFNKISQITTIIIKFAYKIDRFRDRNDIL